jgi:hypothetical protein
MATEFENDHQKNVTKLSQAHDVSARKVYASLMRTAKLGQEGEKTVYLVDEEGAIQDV